MVRDQEDAVASRGPYKLPSGCRTFWRSASWSSRTSSLEPAKGCHNNTDTDSTQAGCFPGPLIPRSNSSKARTCLPPLQPLSITRQNLDEWPKAGSDDVGEWPHPPTPSCITNKGLKLDLSSCLKIPECTGSTFKKDKMTFCDKECSKVAEHIYVGGDAVARDRDILRQHGITHVLNCVGFVCPEYFKADLVYKTLWLQDSPSEDITSILYDVFDYFEDVREQGGRVLVHCCQGVSRSISLVIAYLMWREGQSFDDAFEYVKAARSIANPNMGFACQLLQCQKRVHAIPLSPSSVLRMYRMAPHSPYDPLHLVPKILNDPSPSALDSRGAFIVLVPTAIYIWIGVNCELVMERDAKAAAFQVVRYERVEGSMVTVKEGEEPSDFWDTFTNFFISVDNSESVPVMKQLIQTAGRIGVGNMKVNSYDADFELFHKALSGGATQVSCSTSGPGARESNWSVLRRKFMSGGLKEWVSASTPMLCRMHSNSLLAMHGDNLARTYESSSRSAVSDSSMQMKSSSACSLSTSAASFSSLLTPVSLASFSLSRSCDPHMDIQKCPNADPALLPLNSAVRSSSKEHAGSLIEHDGSLPPSVTLPSSFSRSQEEEERSNKYSYENDKTALHFSTIFNSVNCDPDVLKGSHPLVYRWPDLEVINDFVLADLNLKCIYLFLAPATAASGHGERKLYLWAGSQCATESKLTQVNISSYEEEIEWNCIGSECLALLGLPKEIPIEVIRGDHEKPEEFMQMLGSFPDKRH